MNNKNPFTGAIINFFFWGLGYVYCGRRSLFGSLIFAGFVFMHLPLLYRANWFEFTNIYTPLGHIILSLAFAVDLIKLSKIKEEKKREETKLLLDHQ